MPAQRLAFMIDSLAGPVAGTERQLWELLKRIDRRRYEPEVILLRACPTGNWEGEWPCRVAQFSVDRLLSYRGMRELLAIRRYLVKRDIKIVHAFFPDSLLVAPVVARLAGARAITSRRDMGLWYSPARLLLVRIANRFVERVVANSRVVAGCAAHHEGIKAERLEVIYNGVPTRSAESGVSLRERLCLSNDAPVVGMVANLRPVKRHADLIKAVARVRKSVPNVHLVLIGVGSEEAPLRALSEREGIGEIVHFLGHVREPAQWISEFSVAALCSESEGLSNALIEYLQNGVPAVCTDVGGNPEIVVDGRSGFLVPVGDVEQLAEYITRILQDSKLASELSENARCTSARFSVAAMIEAYMALYDEVLERRKDSERGLASDPGARL